MPRPNRPRVIFFMICDHLVPEHSGIIYSAIFMPSNFYLRSMEDDKNKKIRIIVLWMGMGVILTIFALMSYPDLSSVDYYILIAVVILTSISIYQIIKLKKK
jgi:hypothetical protein